PQRTAAGVRRILRAQLGWSPDETTLCRHFTRLGLMGPKAAETVSVFGRFEATRPNELWTGDALHGPVIAGRKTFLFAFIDDHCAPRSASLYPRRSREELGGRFLGLMAYPASKGNTGTVACQESSGRAQAYEARRCGTRAIRLRQNCLNPNLQEMQVDIHRKD